MSIDLPKTVPATSPEERRKRQRDLAEAPALRPGQVIDSYVIEDTLGVGGMGRVYAAFDWALNRRVAIKVARWFDGNDALEHEARLMASFRHPGVPAVYAVGYHGDHAFVVMEYIAGRTLAEYLRVRGRLSARDAGRILRAVCDNLQALHRAGLAHRDLKPSNIMLGSEGRPEGRPEGRIVLIDFGLCSPNRRTPSQTVAGSAHYMAPEVALKQVQVGRAHLTDLYALGVIGFTMLCGQTPFTGHNVIEVLDAQMEQSAPLAHVLQPGTPRPMSQLLARLLARDPDSRPQSIDLVAAQLAELAQLEEEDTQLLTTIARPAPNSKFAA